MNPNDAFDIYQERRSAATVVISAGAPLRTFSDGTCIATVGNNLEMLFHAVAAPTAAP